MSAHVKLEQEVPLWQQPPESPVILPENPPLIPLTMEDYNKLITQPHRFEATDTKAEILRCMVLEEVGKVHARFLKLHNNAHRINKLYKEVAVSVFNRISTCLLPTHVRRIYEKTKFALKTKLEKEIKLGKVGQELENSLWQWNYYPFIRFHRAETQLLERKWLKGASTTKSGEAVVHEVDEDEETINDPSSLRPMNTAAPRINQDAQYSGSPNSQNMAFMMEPVQMKQTNTGVLLQTAETKMAAQAKKIAAPKFLYPVKVSSRNKAFHENRMSQIANQAGPRKLATVNNEARVNCPPTEQLSHGFDNVQIPYQTREETPSNFPVLQPKEVSRELVIVEQEFPPGTILNDLPSDGFGKVQIPNETREDTPSNHPVSQPKQKSKKLVTVKQETPAGTIPNELPSDGFDNFENPHIAHKEIPSVHPISRPKQKSRELVTVKQETGDGTIPNEQPTAAVGNVQNPHKKRKIERNCEDMPETPSTRPVLQPKREPGELVPVKQEHEDTLAHQSAKFATGLQTPQEIDQKNAEFQTVNRPQASTPAFVAPAAQHPHFVAPTPAEIAYELGGWHEMARTRARNNPRRARELSGALLQMVNNFERFDNLEDLFRELSIMFSQNRN